MISKQIVSEDSVSINYEVHNCAHPTRTLVFIHGFGGCLRAFDGIINHFQSQQYQLINIDLRSHGRSERPRKENQYQFQHFVKDLISILQEEKADNITLIGHCFGGILSLGLTIEHPDLIKSIVLINSSHSTPAWSKFIYKHFPLKKLIFSLLRFVPHWYIKYYPNYDQYQKSGDFNILRITSDILHTSIKSYLYICREITQIDFDRAVNQIGKNILIIHGLKDRVFPMQTAVSLSKKIKHARLEIIDDANHLIVLSHKARLVDIIKENLKQGFL